MIGANFLFEQTQTRVGERQQCNNMLPPCYDVFTLGPDIGEFGYQYVPTLEFKLSPSSCSEESLEHNPDGYHELLQKQIDGLPDGWMSLDCSPESLPNSQPRLSCPCFPQHTCTSNGTVNTGNAPSSVAREDSTPIPSIEIKADDFLDLYNERITGNSLKLDGTEVQHSRERSEAMRKHEDQWSPAPLAQPLCESNSEEDSNREGSWAKQDAPSDNGSRCSRKRWLACPWYKKDPLKHSGCAKYKLLRIKDVKQHICRRHTNPSTYYIRGRSCTPSTESELDGLSEKQRRKLNQNANRGRNDVERWYCMWDTIFPSEPRPLSPYLSSGRQELLPLLRSFWNEKHQHIIRKALQESHRRLEPETIQNIMDAVFDRFESESSYQESDTNEDSGDESSETSNPKKQSPAIVDGIAQDNLPSKLGDTDYGILYESTERQAGHEPNCASEYLNRSQADMYFGIGLGNNLDQYSLRYSF
ncbi:uncharacterized protein F4812DRAFT_434115 [Daldinia caldariorum]|uniref:uncharacterized protein n=1 Tax=Daldinia caldariorum TaxID=326644 RepID=UPI002008D38B|nr:uncharacterized protein F4812DRAFT_434115 [Daldinia caldariorum]KAI1466460.1 hypothetical protein F4812DRAFT_434115 [Daldinia caldariorum]